MNLTRTERRLWKLLGDGSPHTKDELAKFLWDEFGENPKQAIAQHVSNIRFKLPKEFDITTRTIKGKFHYVLTQRVTAETAPVPTV